MVELVLVVVGLVLGEGVEVELSQEGAVVAVPEVKGQEDPAELARLMHHESLAPLRPADQIAVLLLP